MLNDNCTDKELMNSLMKGNERAFNILFDRYINKLHLFAYSHLNDRELAKEIVMDVMLKLWQKKEGKGEISSLNSYLYTSVRNAIIDNYRKKIYDLIPIDEASNELTDHTYPDQKILDEEFQDVLKEGVRQLTPQRQLIFRMKRDQELSYKEIADKLILSPKTVENHMTAAIFSLKCYLKKRTGLATTIVTAILFIFQI